MICEKCGRKHDGTFGSGRFCNRSCANSRVHTKETKRKIGEGVKNSEAFWNSVDKSRKGRKVIKRCPICKNSFRVCPSGVGQIYCSKECYLKDVKHKYSPTSGGYRPGSGRGKSGWYKGIWCDSSWELAYVIYCIDKGFKIKRNVKKFKYIFEGEIHHYIPDFIVSGNYVEVKGYVTNRWKIILKQFPFKLEVLNGNNLGGIFEYVRRKYGNNYIELYVGNPHKLRNNSCMVCGKPAVNMYCSRRCAGLSRKGKKNETNRREFDSPQPYIKKEDKIGNEKM